MRKRYDKAFKAKGALEALRGEKTVQETDTEFCVSALEEAMQRWGIPAIFYTDQGSQFTVSNDGGIERGLETVLYALQRGTVSSAP